MRDQISQPARISLLADTTSEVWLALLHINIDGADFHVVANSETSIISNGQQYDPYPFDVLLPADSLEQIETVQITIDNVDLMLVDALRAAQNPLQFTLQFVLASQPDVVEVELTEMESDSVRFNSRVITATLAINDVWNQKFPSRGPQYDPSQFPGLF